eukprot:751146-Hanusia_phi.AAC.3
MSTTSMHEERCQTRLLQRADQPVGNMNQQHAGEKTTAAHKVQGRVDECGCENERYFIGLGNDIMRSRDEIEERK